MAEENGMTNEEVIETLSEIHQYFVGCYQNAGGTRACEQFDRYMRVANGVKGLLTPVEPERLTVLDFGSFETTVYLCGACRMPIERGDKFCKHCGKKVKWDG